MSRMMEETFRTPSPIPEAYRPSGDISPPEKIKIPLLPATPLANPLGRQQPLDVFGLLTPSTPDFVNTFEHAPAFAPAEKNSSDNDAMLQNATSKGQSKICDTKIQANPVMMEQKPHEQRTSAVLQTEGATDTDLFMQTPHDRLQRCIREAELCTKSANEADTPGKRRSTRLATKKATQVPFDIILPLSTPSRLTRPINSARESSPPESSLTSRAVAQVPSETIPGHLTLDWQLQYPPGGSTHPAYVYPQLDPRLLFDPAVVPVSDGLPNVFCLPPLVLPVGFRHISWTGCLPIVFDAYHQAFKLTPVGPLPLTCEEVQQGGLAKYVPGGSEHPEAGLLPDMSKLSDGSEAEMYSFEDVDWTLPWPKDENFASAPASGIDNGGLAVAANVPLSHYIETRDCPDDIVDINDAWRWLVEKDKDCTVRFEATTGKTWRGTGIRRTSRRIKSPIANLLAVAVADTLKAPDDSFAKYLVNQNGRAFCPFRSVATPVQVNITLLADIEFTLKEFLSYFPSHYMWRKGGDRLVQADMTKADIANMINMTRQLSGEASRKSDSIGNAIFYESGRNGERIVRDYRDNEPGYTAEGWTNETVALIDYPLFGLSHGLVTLPEGKEAGPLTQLIYWCRQHHKYDVMLSEIPSMLQEAGITSLIEPDENGCPDKAMLSRYVERLKIDRRRVLKAAAKKRRMFEDVEETEGKKMRQV